MRYLLSILIISLVFGGFTFSPALAQETTSADTAETELGLTPDSPFYFLDGLWKSVRLTFTFNKVKKTELRLKFAEEKLAEAEKMQAENKITAMEKALKRYQLQVERAGEQAERREEVAEKVAEATAKHLGFLERIREKAPEKAQEALLKAKEVSEIGHFKAIEVLRKIKPEQAKKIEISNFVQVKVRIEKQVQERKERQEKVQTGTQNKVQIQTEGDIKETKSLWERLKIRLRTQDYIAVDCMDEKGNFVPCEKDDKLIKPTTDCMDEKGNFIPCEKDDKLIKPTTDCMDEKGNFIPCEKDDELIKPTTINSSDFQPRNLTYEIQEKGVLIKWDSPLETSDIVKYQISTKGWGVRWVEVTRTDQTNYYLRRNMDENICDLDVRITPVSTEGKELSYSAAFLHNIKHVADKDTWNKDCGPINTTTNVNDTTTTQSQ